MKYFFTGLPHSGCTVFSRILSKMETVNNGIAFFHMIEDDIYKLLNRKNYFINNYGYIDYDYFMELFGGEVKIIHTKIDLNKWLGKLHSLYNKEVITEKDKRYFYTRFGVDYFSEQKCIDSWNEVESFVDKYRYSEILLEVDIKTDFDKNESICEFINIPFTNLIRNGN